MTRSTVRAGDHVVVERMPPSAAAFPEDVRRLFRAAVGTTLRVDEVDAETGCVALNVRDDGTQAADWTAHTIWIEVECVRRAGTGPAPGGDAAAG